MATVINMPKMGINMEEGNLLRFFVNEGESIKKGEPLFEIETDKTSMTIEAAVDGTLLKILAECDEYYDCGTPLAILGEPGEDISAII